MKPFSQNTDDHVILMRKLMTICPICGRQIFGKDIDIDRVKSAKSQIDHWPLRYVYCHSHEEFPMHALTIYLDANFSVRGMEASNFVKIQK